MPLTQQAIGEHLGLSQQQAGAWLERLGLTPEAGLDAIRLRYIEALREAAADRGPSAERDGMHRARRELLELRVAREAGRLVEADAVRRCIVPTARAFRDKLTDVRVNVQAQYPQLPRPVFELIERLHRMALEELVTALRRDLEEKDIA